MKSLRIQFAAATVACASMLASPLLMAAPVARKAGPTDIALRDGGVLVGQMMTQQGTALDATPISIQQNGREVIRVATNAKGEFTVANLKGGVYQVVAPGHQGSYRLWAPNTAPPAASTGLMAVSGNQAVLGQYQNQPGPFATVTNWVAQHKILTAGIVTAAIAIPLALDDDDNSTATTP